MPQTLRLWSTEHRSRWFLISENISWLPGTLAVRCLDGTCAGADPSWLTRFETTQAEAHEFAKEQLGQALDELKQGIDERLLALREQLEEAKHSPVSEHTTATANASRVLFDLLRKLPAVIGNSLSGSEERVMSARAAMADLQHRLNDAGIELDERFTCFPDRLAGLRGTCRSQSE